jgi:undecaprenyl diphosphate synthase
MKALFERMRPGEPDWTLAESLDAARLPKHIAIIMDGNGRWARKRSLPRVAGHRAGVEPVRICVETCSRLGIEALTLYAFSVENWKRPRGEVDTLWRLLHFYLRREVPELMKNNIRFNAVGRLNGLSEQVMRELEEARRATSRNTGMWLNLAINYGGRAELVDAMNALLDQARLEGRLAELHVTEELVESQLYTANLPDPDLLIRTSGEMRISNFLLWQIAYAELYVTETLWPDFSRQDLLKAVAAYQARERRFGGLTSLQANDSRAGTPLAEALR